VGAVLFLGAALIAGGCAGTKLTAPAITATPTDVSLPGKFVWVDLLTDDLAGAKQFYGELFGWTFETVQGTDNYVTIRNDGELAGGILEVKRKKEHDSVAQWLGYISVANVDDTVKIYESKGGELHYGPVDIPGRGRAAVVSDSQGAYVALLRSETGDPLDRSETPGENAFTWVDYVANDPDEAFAFMADTFGWKHEVHHQTDDGVYYVFRQGDKPRAGLFKNPWPNVRPNWLPYVRVSDAQSATEKVKSLGGSVILEPSEEVRAGSVAVVVDPAGAGFVLQKYPFKEAS
jgi:predicted enzyme related to lactoylglutathione lyase